MIESQAQTPSPAQVRRRSRYDRPRSPIVWSLLVIGVIIGVIGGMFFAWNIAPSEEFDTEPWQLVKNDQARYVVAIALAFSYDGDLGRTLTALSELRPSVDPIQYVADVACDLARTGYVDSSSGLNAVRAMMNFYQLQGRKGCADDLIPPLEIIQATEEIRVAASPTLQPPPTKTPLPDVAVQPTLTPDVIILPTPVTQTSYLLARLEPFCDTVSRGVIEVRVRDSGGVAIPGQPIRVTWDEGESTFFTGLKPDRGLDYADFQMEAGKGYTIDMPGLSDPSTTQMVASACTTASGEESLQSYFVVFVPSFE